MILDRCWWDGIYNGWKQLVGLNTLEEGDVVVYLKMDEDDQDRFDEDFCFPVLGNISGHSLENDDGFIISALAGYHVSHISTIEFPEKHEGYCYAVFRRKQEKRVYKPSKWAEPLPLP